jgi:predicted dehydrogenase
LKSYRAAVIGLSGIGTGSPPGTSPYPVLGTEWPHSHVAAYHALPQAEVVAACDIKPDVLETFRATWGAALPDVRTYLDYRELLEKERPDILSVVTSDHRHAQITIDAAEAGVKAILCEKPLATTIAEAERMIATCDRTGTALTVNHSRRWTPHWNGLRALVGEGRPLGPVRRIAGTWAGNRAMLFRNGGHLIDTINWFAGAAGRGQAGAAGQGQPGGGDQGQASGAGQGGTATGEPDWVVGVLDAAHTDHAPRYTGDGGRDPALDPGGNALVYYKNGVRAFVNCSKGITGGGVELEVFCENGHLRADDVSGEIIVVPPGRSSHGRARTPVKPPVTSLGDTPAAIAELIASIEEGRTPRYTAQEARWAPAIILAMLQSNANGHAPVRFPIQDV